MLEIQQYQLVGGETILNSDVRLISATNKSVASLIEEGAFREDLFYRLNVIPIQIPPLRQRRDDIPLLVEHFLAHFCERHGRPVKHVAPEAMEKLIVARWPGNIRQLRNVVERLVITVSDDVIHAVDVPADLGPQTTGTAPTRTLADTVEEAEKDAITNALATCDYHREKTAQLLGVSVRTLHYKMSRYGLH